MSDPVELALRGYEPTVRPPVLTGSDLMYVVDDTPIGRMLFAARADGRVLVTTYVRDDEQADAVLDRLARHVSPSVLRGGRALDAVRRELEEYLAGHRRAFDVPLDLALATPFQHDVLTALGGVGYGRTTTYGAVASGLGRPTASRAVGAALGANPLCVLLPCHRVVASSGALTGYAGGVEVKRRLLELERAAA